MNIPLPESNSTRMMISVPQVVAACTRYFGGV
jgi:hypothetical protein